SPTTALTGRRRPTTAAVARTTSGVTVPNPAATSLRSTMSAPCRTAISASSGPVTLASMRDITSPPDQAAPSSSLYYASRLWLSLVQVAAGNPRSQTTSDEP